jgi:type I restriction enzyme S subunit
MNAERLLEHYERIADATDAIPRLRRFILDLAVRGKLVSQDSRDEPASELVKRIATEKKRLVNAKEIRKGKLSPPIRSDEFPLPLPENWAWLRLHEIGNLSGGMTPSMNRPDFWDGDIVWLSPKDIKTDEVSNSELKITAEGVSETRLEVYRPGSLFMVARSGILKRIFPVSINRVPAAANQDMKVLVPFLGGQERYLQIMFRGLTDFILGKLVKTGTTVQSLKYAEFEEQPFPLPPLLEQHRIVAKVDELMALCDRLEAARAGRETTRDRLAAASLARLNAPDPDPATFAGHARFALNNLTSLTTRPEQVAQLRQTILNLAMSGRLSESEGWPSSPNKLGDVASLQNGYAFKSEWFAKSGTRLLRNANVSHGILNWAEEVRLPNKMVAEYERFRLRENDVVLSLDRPFIVTGTKVARVQAGDLPALLLQRVGRFLLSDALDAEYLFMWINSPLFSDQIDPGRSNGVPHISSKQVEAAGLFVPPLAEQHRIVAKVDALMALCDRLEASLTTGDDQRSRLLDALFAEALVPAEDFAPIKAERVAAHG